MRPLTKQVIIVRKDLNMRKGKMIAQGCHASLGAFKECQSLYSSEDYRENNILINWYQSGQTKIAVGCDSEKELLDLFDEARRACLPASLVLDEGRTEFKEPTYTCCAIGPAESGLIDKITGHLKLL